MIIEILYILDCPGLQPTLDAISRIIREHKVAATLTAVEIADHNAIGFRGSPTVRIDGKDIEDAPESSDCGLTCRTYLQAGKLSNCPSEDMIRIAILRTLD